MITSYLFFKNLNSCKINAAIFVISTVFISSLPKEVLLLNLLKVKYNSSKEAGTIDKDVP